MPLSIETTISLLFDNNTLSIVKHFIESKGLPKSSISNIVCSFERAISQDLQHPKQVTGSVNPTEGKSVKVKGLMKKANYS